MNIKIQCCGLVLILVVLVLYLRQKKLYLNTQKLFLVEAITILISISLDIGSVVAIIRHDELSELFVTTICKLYLVSLVAVAFVGLLYICVDIYKGLAFQVREILFSTVLFIAAEIAVLALPIEYVIKEGGLVYTKGPSVIATYASTMIIMGIIICEIVAQKKRINPDRRVAVMMWMGLWLLGAIVQMIVPSCLVVGFMLSLGFMVIYIKLENPEMNIDRETGYYNQNAFRELIRQMYGDEKEFSVLIAIFEHFSGNVSEIKQVNDVYIFRRTAEELLFVSESPEKIQLVNEELARHYKNGQRKVERILIPDSTQLNSADDMFYFIRNVYRMIPGVMDDGYMKVNEDMVKEMYREKNMESLLDDAINRGRVEVFYQPIYSIEDKAFTSAEALVRIRSEEGDIISPFEFIPVAEKTGKILELGRIVFEQVCQFIKENNMVQLGLHYIEVNLSVVQCGDEALADTYISIMKKYEVLPKFINLEITESASMAAKDILLENMKVLMNYGVSFSLDDFGTGQSNLNYIVDMPVNIVKFDKGMTRAYFDSRKAKYVMDAAMHMIHGMGLKIVSEGIETEDQYKVMEELGICYIQGYYFSKPLPKKEFLRFLQNA